MIIPSLYHLIKFVETLRGRDEEDMITITLPLGDLRTLTTDSAHNYTSPDDNRR